MQWQVEANRNRSDYYREDVVLPDGGLRKRNREDEAHREDLVIYTGNMNEKQYY